MHRRLGEVTHALQQLAAKPHSLEEAAALQAQLDQADADRQAAASRWPAHRVPTSRTCQDNPNAIPRPGHIDSLTPTAHRPASCCRALQDCGC